MNTYKLFKNTFLLSGNRVNPFSLATIALAMTVSGCGKQAYKVTSSAQEQQAPGSFMVPPKVDILLVEDDTGSIFEAYSAISNQFPKFLKKLQAKGWDYHFATVPLTTDRVLDKVVGSQFDVNWGALWVPPFPGARRESLFGQIVPQFFRKPDATYGGFITQDTVNNSLGGYEPGFETIQKALNDRIQGTGFLRKDALLVVMVVGNGNDTSLVNFCKRSDKYVGTCEDAGFPRCPAGMTLNESLGLECGNSHLSYEYFKGEIADTKTNSKQIQFHSAVASTRQNACLGSTSRIGTRYQQMALDLGGRSYDICNQSIPSVLNSLDESLTATKVSYRTQYLFIDSQPNVNSIEVIKYPGGDRSGPGVPIHEDPVNGWTYAGQGTFPAIDFPYETNYATGYAIKLNGAARLLGADTATVHFQPFGIEDSVAD